MTDNPFEIDLEGEKEFLKTYPRWKFYNCWKPFKGLSGFNLLNIWWWKNGTCGVCLLNFSVGYNPYHEEAK